MKLRVIHWLSVAAFFVFGGTAFGGNELEPGVRLKADGKLIDTDVGHAAPFLFDLDSDGDRDLLVGQFGDGKLKFYFNTGTDKKPVYGKPEWFKIGKEFGKIPSG